MPVYDIAFTPEFAGLEAVVRNATTGTEVAASPVTLDAAGSAQITLDAGIYKATASHTQLGLLNVTTEVTRNVDASFDGAGAGLSGDGPPVTDPTTLTPGTQYVDETSGALYIVILNPAGPIEEWALVGGEIDGVNQIQGVVLGNGVSILGKSVNGGQVVITDVDAYNDSGCGICWNGTGTDGEQTFQVRTGPAGMYALALYNDGYLDVPGTLKAAGPVGTTAAEPADGSVNAGECFMWFDSANGAASVNFKGKTLDGTVVEATVAMS